MTESRSHLDLRYIPYTPQDQPYIPPKPVPQLPPKDKEIVVQREVVVHAPPPPGSTEPSEEMVLALRKLRKVFSMIICLLHMYAG